jgi:hypothetical protein
MSCRLLRVHLEPYLVADRRGGSSYRLDLEFRDVLRLHLAPALVLKSHDGRWRSLAETAYLCYGAVRRNEMHLFKQQGAEDPQTVVGQIPVIDYGPYFAGAP